MQEKKYVDLHCDSITSCCESKGNFYNFNGQINLKKLTVANCLVQCVAVFTNGKNAKRKFNKYINFYCETLEKYADFLLPIKSYKDVVLAEKTGKIGLLLTVENLSFLGEEIEKIATLKMLGVGMASLVWNEENAFAYPVYSGANDKKRSKKNLKTLGKRAVELLDENRIIIDLSHLSDGGVKEILKDRKTPLVASHSNCNAVCFHPRNLTDAQIKKIADCGGVVGVNFYDKFLGERGVNGVLKHIEHLLNVGGEEVVALGSDFDGIPNDNTLNSCEYMCDIYRLLEVKSISPRIIEKIMQKNALRVIKDVL